MPTKEPHRPSPERSDHQKLVHHHHPVVGDGGQVTNPHLHIICAKASVAVRSEPLGRRLLAALDAVARHPLVNTALRFVAEVLLRN